MQQTICDRCGKVLREIEHHTLVEENYGMKSRVYDVCDECWEEVLAFIRGKDLECQEQ